MSNTLKNVKAMTFDVFGTVVDWRSSISREVKSIASPKGVDIDWNNFADKWRDGYGPSMNKVRTGELPWLKIDDLHKIILDELLISLNINVFSDEEKTHLNKAWHRLTPWNDSVEGLTNLKKSFVITTLSNGNVSLLVNMAKFGGLPWDTVLSAELCNHYKPDKEAYLSTSQFLGFPIKEIMMVAAHKGDLKAAKENGMCTAYIPRPLEFGTKTMIDDSDENYIDIKATDIIDLSNKMTLLIADR
jgi:2-haloacid dehalogenase